jgi:hypothetical protein
MASATDRAGRPDPDLIQQRVGRDGVQRLTPGARAAVARARAFAEAWPAQRQMRDLGGITLR